MNRAHDLAQQLDLAHDLVHSLARDLALDLGLTDISSSLLEDLTDIADNFVGADLRAAVGFDSTDLEGIRWSPTTAWPPEWADRVRGISIEISPGIFQVVEGDGRDSRSFHEAGT